MFVGLAGRFMESRANDTVSWIGLLLLTAVFGGLWYALNSAVDVLEISRNWPKYRCSPTVMPFASMYGYNTSENFQFCLQNVFQSNVGAVTGPFGNILGSITGTLMTFLQNLNSLRVMMATLVGGVSKIFQEFTDRFKLLMMQIRQTGLHLQMLMRRVYGTFFAVIYMGLSAVTVGMNFGDSFIFSFLDTFCFAPETPIQLRGRGSVPISSVKCGDVLESGATVLSTYRFMADGQPMVRLGDIEVSTNHFVQLNGSWIQAKDHPDAIPLPAWSGGSERPLICLDTDTHQIHLGAYVFSDWDETSQSDEATMKQAEVHLNGEASSESKPWLYQPAIDPDTQIRLKSGACKPAKELEVGDEVTTGRVTGAGWRHVFKTTETAKGVRVTPSTLVWFPEMGQWVRAGSLWAPIQLHPQGVRMRTLCIEGTATFETEQGETLRDMLEVWSPSMEEPTKHALNPTCAIGDST